MATYGEELNFGSGLTVIFYEVNVANPAPYNQTEFWRKAQYYLKFIKEEKDGKKETLIPGRGSLKEFQSSFNDLKSKLEKKEVLSEKDFKFLPLPVEFKPALLTNNNESSDFRSFDSSASHESISSILSSNKQKDIIQKDKEKTSRIPKLIRSNSILSNNNSLNSTNSCSSSRLAPSSKNSTPILTRKNSNLLFNNNDRDNKSQSEKEFMYEINKGRNWILISLKLLVVVKAEKLIENIDSRKDDALTYRNTERVRLMDLNKKEISTLEENLPRLCENLKSNERVNIFRH